MLRSINCYLIFILLVSLVSAQDKNGPINIELYKSFTAPEEIQLSHFVNEVKLIPLENSPQALINDLVVNYEVTDEFIIVRQSMSGKHQILLFDRNTGRFIRQIGTQGRGPCEFERWSHLPYNETKNELYAITYSQDILAYNPSGKYIDMIRIPYLPDPNLVKPKNNPENFVKSFMLFYQILESNIFVGYFQNFSGWENKKIILITKEGVLKIFPNYLTWDRNTGPGFMYPPGGFAKFYRWDNKVYFLETFCDTLYEVTKERLIPRYYFDAGSFKAHYSKQVDIASKWYDYFLIDKVIENSKYVFFTFSFSKKRYLGFVDKRSNSVTICKTTSSGNSAFNDDINYLMDVVPDHFTQKDEMIYIIKPGQLIKWLKENPDKVDKASNINPFLKIVNEFNNPIIAIGKCKD